MPELLERQKRVSQLPNQLPGFLYLKKKVKEKNKAPNAQSCDTAIREIRKLITKLLLQELTYIAISSGLLSSSNFQWDFQDGFQNQRNAVLSTYTEKKSFCKL